MTQPSFPGRILSHLCRTLLRLLVAVLLIGCAWPTHAAAPGAPRAFHVAAGPAVETLKQFSAQSEAQLLYSSSAVEGVRTNAVEGQLTPREALERMVEHTELVARQDEKTGALVVRRLAEPPVEKTDATGKDGRRSSRTKTVDDTVVLEQVDVTGTRIGLVNEGVIPRRENEAVRYEVIDRAAIDRSGAASLPEFFRNVSSNTAFGTNTQAQYSFQLGSSGGILFTGDSVNLRGLGEGQTLVMINGRRLYGGEGGGADVGRIPLNAVERIEILPTSGSAIYGANAVGGVINIVLRKDYNGSEITNYFGAARGGAEEYRLSLYQGFVLNDGRTNVTLSAEFTDRNALTLGDRHYYLEAPNHVAPTAPGYGREIARNFTGPLATVSLPYGVFTGLGIPSNPSANYAGVPATATGAPLTPADFNATANQANLSTSRLDRVKLLPPLKSYSLFSAIDHTPAHGPIGLYAELSWRYADTSSGSYPGAIFPINMPANNPYNPFRTNVTPGFVGRRLDLYFDPVDLPQDTNRGYQRTLRAVGGLKGTFALGAGYNYDWAVDFSWDHNEGYSLGDSYVRILAPAINAGFYNPFRDLSKVAPVAAADLPNFRSRIEQHVHPEIAATNWRLNGDLFSLWGNRARISLGLEARLENDYADLTEDDGAYADLPGSTVASGTQVTQTYRRAFATYAEVTIPLVGKANRLPLVYALDLSAATRFEQYDDFGSASPPMVGLKYSPTADFSFRATYSEGFQPPTQVDLYAPVQDFGSFAGFGLIDPARNFEEANPDHYLSGGNPNLRPETSKTWDAGIILTPRFIPGLTLSASYFRYDKHDLVGYLDIQDLIDTVPSRVTRGPNLPGDPAGLPGPIVSVDGSAINIARQLTDGWDFKADYQGVKTSWGRLGGSADATYTHTFRRQNLPGQPFIDTTGDVGLAFDSVPMRLRGKAVVWFEAGHTHWSWTTRYISSYITSSNDPTDADPTRSGYDGPNISSSIEHDFQFSYTIPYRARATGSRLDSWLSGTKWTIGVLNVFDARPPYHTGRLGLWYSLLNDPRQRFGYIEIRKSL